MKKFTFNSTKYELVHIFVIVKVNKNAKRQNKAMQNKAMQNKTIYKGKY